MLTNHITISNKATNPEAYLSQNPYNKVQHHVSRFIDQETCKIPRDSSRKKNNHQVITTYFSNQSCHVKKHQQLSRIPRKKDRKFLEVFVIEKEHVGGTDSNMQCANNKECGKNAEVPKTLAQAQS
jgi:hypothetical protein